MRMLVPGKEGREEEGLRWDLGAELFGLLALFWAWPLRPPKTTCKLVSGRTVTVTTVKIPGLLGWGLQQLL